MTEILHSKITGDKPKHLLILHGLFGQSDNFATLSKQFAEFYTVHAIDLRNHGRSFHSDDMSFDAMSDDILNYLNHHQIESCYLLGHSLGGRSVIEFSYKHPKNIDKLIVADMAPKAYPPHHQGIIKALNSIDFDKIEKRSDVEEILKQYIPDIGTRQFLLKNVYHAENGKYAFRFNLKTLTDSYDGMVGGNLSNGIFDKPTLFLRGSKSDYVLDADFDLIRKHFPQAEIQTVSNSGHWVHAENPQEFFQKTIAFLEN
ncbi:alpha/beta fold hydrolase [Moheibacter sediminis]|uniref:Pimeloyl-ACP methyl ester carboxylesterase n=1 Tax=Moheibacter sediminis TaxID=1434700 RepID=A0A1W2BDE5_9FLAO|nr:alpha/beta fold hydrolase [Moheibacter sediminis]SMC70790.1 Pimeloyl-ACP methyl ester carboxylesterase [Moheibacter sediminis]